MRFGLGVPREQLITEAGSQVQQMRTDMDGYRLDAGHAVVSIRLVPMWHRAH